MKNNDKALNNHVSWLQQWLERVWYNNGSGRWLLLPLTGLYCALNWLHRWKDSRHHPQLPCPVIVVGNITVGGTGKTPLTIHLINLLKKSGYKPGIITRGYGGQSEVWPQEVMAQSHATLVGDEAVLMAQRTGVPVFAGPKRLASIAKLCEKYDCDMIISDDGMQHYKLPRDIQIAVIDGKRQLGNGYCLPAGPLREKKRRLVHCDFIVVNGQKANNKSDNNWHFMSVAGATLVNVKTAEEKMLADFADDNKDVYAITGIGNPQRFYQALEQAGLCINSHSFPDHYDFKETDLVFDKNIPIIMTEKDAVKCLNFATDNMWFLPVKAKLDKHFDNSFMKKINRLIAQNR